MFIAGEGAPDYAALYMNRTVKPLPFPEPIPSLTPYKLDPNTGYNIEQQFTIKNESVLLCLLVYGTFQVSIQR